MRADDLATLIAALRRAATQLVWSGECDLSDALYPFWRDAVHEMLVRRGCPCTRDRASECFLSLEPHEQRTKLKGDIGLDAFTKFFNDARAVFFAEAARPRAD
jgi:hypothetical protein